MRKLTSTILALTMAAAACAVVPAAVYADDLAGTMLHRLLRLQLHLLLLRLPKVRKQSIILPW